MNILNLWHGSESFLRLGLKLSPAVIAMLALTGGQAMAQTIPDFGPNVYIFDPTMSNTTIQSTLVSLANEAQFSTNRYAVLFKPGTYTLQSEVGYYESIAGLGVTPQAVAVNGYLTSNQTDSNGNLTDNFWRSLDNLEINDTGTFQWGVSQGADFRRMYVNGALELTNTSCGEASGGFIADTVVVGNVNPCSQQQWYTRNSTLGGWSGGVWNMVFSGVQGTPVPNYPTNSYTILPTTPVSREKAFLYVDSGENYNVFVPATQTNSSGTSWLNGTAPGYSLPISSFFIAQPTNTLSDINNALAYGLNLILTPGIYQYSGSINITNPNTIVLGLGFATIVPQNGTSAINIADVDGVQVSGVLIDAGPVNSPVLLEVGVAGGSGVSHQTNPTSLNDVYFRIGGASTGLASTTLEIDSNNVILDNIWAWRADHGQTPVGWTINVANNGVVVNGNNVTALGLAVEHYEQNQVVWNGNGGETIFYQSELPYDVPSQSAWMNGSTDGYSSYLVSSSVTSHAAYGLGVYSYFNQGIPIVETSAITVPNVVGVSVTDAVSVFLAGSGSTTYTVDNVGTTAQSGSITSYVPFYQGVACSTTCPAAPTSLVATPISPTQINLAWSASATPYVQYTVFRGTTSGFTPSSSNRLIYDVAGTSYADTTAQPSTTYYYLVEAVSNAGTSAPSNLANAITSANGGLIGTDVLDIDSGYTSTSPPTHWVVDMDYTGGATGSVTHAITVPSSVVNPAPTAVYQSYRKLSSGASFSYAIPGLTAGGSYIVDLHFAEDYFSAIKSREFDVSINGTQVLTNFDIFATAGAEYTATVQSFYATADSTGTITIVFSNGAVNSPQVNGIEIGLGSLAVPIAPTHLAANVASSSQINLSWNASTTSGVAYEVFRSTVSGFTPSTSNLITTTFLTTFSDNNLAASTTYYYVVEANNSVLSSLPSQQAIGTTSNTAALSPSTPAAPTSLTGSAVSGSQINLFWIGSPTPIVQYEIFRSTVSGFTPSSSNLLATTSATGYADTGLSSSTTFYYVVEALNTNGSSGMTNQAVVTTSSPTSSAITWNPSTTNGYSDNAIGAGVLDATTSAAGMITYTATPTGGIPASITSSTVLSPATYTLTANFTPSDPSSYTTATVSISFIVQNMNLFVVNSGGSVLSLYNNGAAASGVASGGGAGAAVDASGYVWSINTDGASVSKFTDAGALALSIGSIGVSGAASLAVDGNGQVWIPSGSSNVSVLSNAGSLLFTLSDLSISGSSGVAIDISGNVWIANSTTNTVDEIIGAAAPAAPLAIGVTNSTTGVEP